MKRILIIVTIFCSTFTLCFVLRLLSPQRQQCFNQIPFNLDCKTCFYVGHDLIAKGPHWYWDCDYTGNLSGYHTWLYNLELDKAEQGRAQRRLATYRECKKQLKGKKPKVETLRVMRTASSFVMNNPSYFSRDISNNTITEKGKGADEEDIYVLYLSDGIVFKASPRDKPQWLGTKVGEKVRKVTSYEAVLHGNTYKVDTIVRYSPLYE